MKLIHSTPDRLLLQHLKILLDAEDVTCETRRDELGMTFGDVPGHETWAEIWAEDADAERATAIVRGALDANVRPTQAATAGWTCACGERLEGEFDACWSCGKERATA